MSAGITQVYYPQGVQLRNVATRTGRFLWHLLQMVLAMAAGMMIYHALVATVLAGTGFAALTKDVPLFGYWMMVASMVPGMIALMRFYKSSWRTCCEMSLAMLAPLAVLTVLVLCTLVPVHILTRLGDPIMIVAMAAYMIYRPDHHAQSAHGVHAM